MCSLEQQTSECSFSTRLVIAAPGKATGPKTDSACFRPGVDDDTNNKLWKLVPVNYTKSMTRAVPGLEAGRKGYGRDADIVKTIGAMTLATSEVDMAMTVARVVEMADAILLRPGTIVNTM